MTTSLQASDPSDLLHRTWLLTAVTSLAIAHWLFGNLYEQLVSAPTGLVDPAPGALVGPLDLGSPVYYYGPSIPVTLALVWVLAERVRRLAPAARVAVRATRAAALAVGAAAVLKVLLITSVNPGFRDAASTPDDIRAATVLWLVGNGSVVLLLAVALVGVLAWRRPPAAPVATPGTMPMSIPISMASDSHSVSSAGPAGLSRRGGS